MRRREFIALLGAAIAWPRTSIAQQQPKYIGVLAPSSGPYRAGFDGVREGLKITGFEEGEQLRLVLREGRVDAIEKAAKEFENDGAHVLVTFGTSVSIATKRATTNVPIVFVAGSDPVAFGLAESIARPGDRLTGITSFSADITPKRLALLREIVPTLKRVFAFYDPSNPVAQSAMATLRLAAQALPAELMELKASSEADIGSSLDALEDEPAAAIFFINDPLVISQAQLILDRALSLSMATMVQNLEMVEKGALAGYGPNFREQGRFVAQRYVSRILSGTRPGELPVEVSRHALGINLKTARALGIEIPPTLLARADEVIE